MSRPKASRPAPTAVEPPRAEGLRLRARLRYLYHGSSPLSVRFRLTVRVSVRNVCMPRP